MSRAFRFAVLLIGAAFIAASGPSRGEDKKPAKWAPSVDLGDAAGKTWLLGPARTGALMASDKPYRVAELPKRL